MEARSGSPLALKRQVGVLGVVSFGAGTAIGVSIFSVLAPAAQVAGSGLLVATVLAALPMVMYGIIYAYLSSALPRAGASYEWPRALIHPVAGFLIAWLRIVSNVGAIVVLAFVLYSYLSAVIPLPLKGTMAAAITVAFVLNYFGVSVAARAQSLLMGLLLAILAAFVLLGASHAHWTTVGSIFDPGWRRILAAIPLLITLFMGIESAAEIGEEVKKAERTIPLGIGLAVLLTIVVYIAVAGIALGLVGPDALAGSKTPLLDAARQPFGRFTALVIVGAATVSILKTLNATTLVFSRSIFAMGRSGALPAALGRIHPRYGTPHVALVICYLSAMTGLLLPSNLTFLLLSVNGPTLLKYMASSLCAVLVVTRHPDIRARAIRFPGAMVVALGTLGIAAGVFLLAAGAGTDARPYALICVWGLIGVAFVIYRRVRTPVRFGDA
jgi:APA family basic amino acid/polyamine antiporter